MIAVTRKLHDSFTVRLEAKNSLSTSLCNGNIDFVRSPLFQELTPKILTEKCSLSGRVSLGKWKLQSLSCAPNFQVRVVS